MKKVLVGVDGSDANRAAVAWAAAEARARGCQLLAVYAWHVPAVAYSVPGYMPISTDWTAEQAAKIVETAVRENSGDGDIDAEARAVEGSAYDTLTRLAAEPAVQMVVVGTGGHGAVTSWLLGSVSHSLSHHCVKPLVMVPHGTGRPASAGIGHIVVGLDGSEGARRALRWAAAEAVLHRARLEVVTAWSWTDPPQGDLGAGNWCDAPTGAQELLEEAVDGLHLDGVHVDLSAREGVASDVLIEAARSSDLLVVGTRGMGRTKEILLGSTSHYCTHHSPVPVAIVPAGAEDRRSEVREHDTEDDVQPV